MRSWPEGMEEGEPRKLSFSRSLRTGRWGVIRVSMLRAHRGTNRGRDGRAPIRAATENGKWEIEKKNPFVGLSND
jgi:hypothetical protein